MGKVRVSGLSLSIDGYGAGPRQSVIDPLGEHGMQLHQWLFSTRAFREMTGQSGGSKGVDDKYAAPAIAGYGAVIMGRNMFGPVRGPWADETWKGWWGEDPPFHSPVFVLSHYPRPPLVMDGGTAFHFVTEGIHAALNQAKIAARGRDVQIGGGVNTTRQFLQAGLVDQLHFAIAPVVLGGGESLFAGLDLCGLGFHVAEFGQGEMAMHVVLSK